MYPKVGNQILGGILEYAVLCINVGAGAVRDQRYLWWANPLTGDSTGCLIAASCDNSAAFDDSHYLLYLGNNYLHNVLTPVK